MSKVKLSKLFIAAIKRKNLKAALEETLKMLGYDEAAAEINETQRLTMATIERTLIPISEAVENEEESEEETEDEGAEDEGAEDEGAEDEGAEDEGAEDEQPNLLITLQNDLEKAIKKGKKKKAKKLLAELEETGLKGSVIKDLAKQVKAL